MKLKNVLIVVRNMQRSRRFYQQLFGLQIVLDQETTVIMTEGLVLQELESWEEALDRDCILRHHMTELYFEETEMDAFLQKLEAYPEPIEYVHECRTYSWGKRVIRLYDPDGNLIEVATPG